MSPLPKSKTLKQQIDANALEHGDRIWLAAPETGRQVSFADGAAQIRDIAQHIANMGLPKGSSIAIASPNSIGACLTFMGIVYGGYVALPLNLVAGAKVLGYILAHSKAALIFVQNDCQDMIKEAMQEAKSTAKTCPLDVNGGPQWAESSPAKSKPNAPIESPKADSIGVLMYTSGTTGNPKGVMLSHHNLLAAGHFISTGHGITKQDRALCVLPIYHINGLCVTVMGTTVSASMLVLPHKFSVSSFWSHIAAYKCSWFSAVPTQFAYILNHPESTEDLSYLRFARSASAPLSPEIHRRFEERFNIPIIETMGLTETGSQITTNPMPPAIRKIGSPGTAFGNEIMIADDTLAAVPTGTIGEILVRGANVMQGYLNQPEETAKTISPDGWLRTGDLGYLDQDGYVFVSGRIKELIIKGGENIAPREIDEALLEHEAVLEAAAFAVPCENYGERVEACIRLKEQMHASAPDLLAHCQTRLGKFKSPDTIHILEDLPKGPSGKVQRLKLFGLVYPTE